MILHPCEWKEQDDKKYVVDVFGRTHEGDIARVRITDFKPYFYFRAKENGPQLDNLLRTIKTKNGYNPQFEFKQETKLDAISGFNMLNPITVWKISFKNLWGFKLVSNELVKIRPNDVFESNIPPFLRLIHERDISPASPFEFEAKLIDGHYEVPYTDITPNLKPKIPMYIMSYDLEVFSDDGKFPQASNASNEIIQIGISTRWSDNLLEPVERFVLVSGECSGPNIISCKDEKDLLTKFQNLVKVEDPDIIVGYNTFGFDDGYVEDRCSKYGLSLELGRTDDTTQTIKKTFELASGKYAVRYLDIRGRLSLDLLLNVRREYTLDSYKLDSVASTFLRDKVTEFIIITGAKTRQFEMHTKSTRGLFPGNLVRFDIVGNTMNPYANGMKFKVKSVFPKKFIVELEDHNYLCTFDDISIEDRKNLEWCFAKDDVSVKEIFESHTGTPAQKATIAKYCLQDCDLVLTLMAKLDILNNSRGMADVCKVPIDYIFLNRGQGIKIYSAVLYNSSKRNQIIMTQQCAEGDISYEGAIVIPPKIGMYLDTPIPVLDFNSLYPSNMIAYNISPDTLVYVKTYNIDGRKFKHEGASEAEIDEIKKVYKIDEISFDLKDDNEVIGRKTCGYIQPTDDPQTIGLLPQTLDLLLKKRKETRKLMEVTEDEAQRSVLNGLQLAYKVVANSVYGQSGSRTSPIRKVEVAACTTAVGRERLLFAKSIVEKEFGAEVVYGDTDSIFIKFPTKDLQESMDLAKKSAERITSLCRKAHKIEYEKTFYPFILFCRKRYIGLMFEDNVNKCKRKFMGIALKRRDSAPIVKDIYGGALDILLEQRSLKNAQDFVKNYLVAVLQNKVPIEKFVISKQLRDDYKNPEQIAHRVLADRMEERDAGNKPQVGDRIAFIYVSGRTGKQGERIEQIDFAKERKLLPDTEFYITNQIQNPVAQLFALSIHEIDGYVPKTYPTFPDLDEEESTLKVLGLKEKELDSLLFMGAQYLNKHKRGPMDMFLKRK